MSLERCSEGFPITSLREIQLLSKLSHKNVVKLIGVNTAKYAPPEQLLLINAKDNSSQSAPFNYPWNFFMVCEYMEHSLRGLLEKNVRFDSLEIRYIMYEVLQGISYLHSHNVMHRDIKCSNILLNNQGEIKIADFGMGTIFQPNKLFKNSQTVVTRWYRAPEILLQQDYTEAIDIWALGCVFGELICGQALFKGNSDSDQLAKIFNLFNDNLISNITKVFFI